LNQIKWIKQNVKGYKAFFECIGMDSEMTNDEVEMNKFIEN